MTKTKKIVIIIVSFLLIIGVAAYNATQTNVNNISLREETIESNKINDSFDGFIVAYFSDLHYGNFTGDNQLNKLVEMINSSGVDLVLFGGDLIDHYSSRGISSENREKLINKLNEINAPYGKFAVLGNHDIDAENSRNDISEILSQGGFSIITNTNVKIYNNKKDYINLIGIDSLSVGHPNIDEAYKGIKENDFNLVITHAPDIFNDLYLIKTDYVLSAHSHGGQIYLPLINVLYRPYGCKEYFKGKYNKDGVTLDITNGIGATKYNARLFSDSELVLYKLQKKWLLRNE